jgi:hypothetical protein
MFGGQQAQENHSPVRRDRGAERVVEHPLHQVGVLGLARGQQQPPAPVEARDGRAGLVVGAIGRQLVRVPKRLAVVPGADAPGQGRLGGHHVVPPGDRRGQQFAVAGLNRDVDDPGLQVQRPDGVPGYRG